MNSSLSEWLSLLSLLGKQRGRGQCKKGSVKGGFTQMGYESEPILRRKPSIDKFVFVCVCVSACACRRSSPVCHGNKEAALDIFLSGSCFPLSIQGLSLLPGSHQFSILSAEPPQVRRQEGITGVRQGGGKI